MSPTHKINWRNNDKTVLVVTIFQPISWETYHEIGEEVNVHLKSVGHTVHVLTVIGMMTSPFPAAGAKEQFNQWIQKASKNHGISVIVNAPPLLKVTVRLFQQATHRLYNTHIDFADTLQEADTLIAEWETRKSERRFRLAQII